jgi:glycosyltransferase involved in cell wall biosynthesis
MTSPRAVVFAPLMPEFDRESGSRRVYHLIELLLSEGWAVTFVAENPRGERYARLLRQRGVAVYGLSDKTIEEVIAYGRFDIALFVFWHLARKHMGMVRRLSPGTRIVVDTIDLHFLRNARRIFQANGHAGGDSLDPVYGAELTGELNTYARVDAVTTVSAKEADLVDDLLGGVTLVRPVLDYEEVPPPRVRFRDRRGLVFLGNFRHPPNVDAVEFLTEEILPRLDDVTDANPVEIVGNGVDDTIRRRVGSRPGVRVIGWVPSVIPYLEHALVSLIPLRYGAGTKRKLLQSLMAGTPTVSTSVGIEGLDVVDGDHLLVADDPDEFAVAIRRLTEDSSLWHALSRQGRKRVNVLHGRREASRRLREVIAAVSVLEPKSAAAEDGGPLPYGELVQYLRDRLERLLPKDATALVVSDGDDDLVRLRDRRAWHFPQTEDGTYAGHHPASSAEAIAQLEELRERGAEFLVFPEPSRWWLSHYRELREHLESRYRVESVDDFAIVYSLTPRPKARANGHERADAFAPDILLPGRAQRMGE